MSLRSMIDIISLAPATTAAKKFKRSQEVQFEAFGLNLERQVEKGLDLLAAEAQLDTELATQAENGFEVSPRAERAGQALARLVEQEVIDQVLAENMLDAQFSRFSVLKALNARE